MPNKPIFVVTTQDIDDKNFYPCDTRETATLLIKTFSRDYLTIDINEQNVITSNYLLEYFVIDETIDNTKDVKL